MSLSEDQRKELVRRACAVRGNAYARYSNFHVGACLLTADGTFFDGTNVENASYGLTNCAERTAVFSAVAAGHTQFVAVAVATDGRHGPCGACRQVLIEFSRDLAVLLVDPADPSAIEETTIGELLPGNFELP